MATFNGERYVAEQINSILNQTIDDWCLYIKDDGSTDNTESILKSYSDEYDKIRLIKDDYPRKGAKWNFMHLLELIDADYYMFCDQDDIWLPTKIEDSYNKLIQIEEVDKPALVCCDLKVVDSDLNTISNSFWKYMKLSPFLLLQKRYAISCNLFTGCTMLFNKKAKEISFPIDDSIILHDYWIGLNVIANNGLISPISNQLILYRQHNYNVCGAHEIGKSLSYYWEKIVGVKKVFLDYKDKYNQANAIFREGVTWPYFIINKIIFVCKR